MCHPLMLADVGSMSEVALLALWFSAAAPQLHMRPFSLAEFERALMDPFHRTVDPGAPLPTNSGGGLMAITLTRVLIRDKAVRDILRPG
jgi:hypothetical protein